LDLCWSAFLFFPSRPLRLLRWATPCSKSSSRRPLLGPWFGRSFPEPKCCFHGLTPPPPRPNCLVDFSPPSTSLSSPGCSPLSVSTPPPLGNRRADVLFPHGFFFFFPAAWPLPLSILSVAPVLSVRGLPLFYSASDPAFLFVKPPPTSGLSFLACILFSLFPPQTSTLFLFSQTAIQPSLFSIFFFFPPCSPPPGPPPIAGTCFG